MPNTEPRSLILIAPAMAQLRSRQWEGNIREFRNILERAVILAGEGVILESHLAGKQRAIAKPHVDSELEINVGLTIDEAEQVLIQATLLHTGNNKTRAASILGISAKTLHVKLKQYSLETEEAPV
jgi:DNA-binding NtrC family response regulator